MGVNLPAAGRTSNGDSYLKNGGMKFEPHDPGCWWERFGTRGSGVPTIRPRRSGLFHAGFGGGFGVDMLEGGCRIVFYINGRVGE